MKVHWDCGHCGRQIKHRWEGDRLVFVCTSSNSSHYFENRITTLCEYKSEIWAWAIPVAELICILILM